MYYLLVIGNDTFTNTWIYHMKFKFFWKAPEFRLIQLNMNDGIVLLVIWYFC